jgi:hypothetical protein
MEFKFKLLGFPIQFRLEVVVAAILLGMFIQANTTYNCLTQEGMAAGGAALNYAMGKGVPGQNNNDGPQLANNPAEMIEKVQVPLPPGQLFMYANNDFKPECCKNSTISGSTGCACETQEQIDYIARRGGNKSSGEF